MLPSPTEIDVLSTERRIARALGHPAFSDWRKQALRSALDRDPTALGNDLELLEQLLRPWVEARNAVEQHSLPHAGTAESNAAPVQNPPVLSRRVRRASPGAALDRS